ncbi:LmbU family transcriptional regulator [Conexibacter woesei]|uniref:LmbU family transcriptional regulator n=1 Tax=Conexibacter woesei TaxID=191495 RepID=UPI0006860B39|nr:LmbU family transcriptional regulator [Conexibacter woesei]
MASTDGLQVTRDERQTDGDGGASCLPKRRPIRPTNTGMRFDPLLPFESWSAIGAKIGAHANASAWWLGDWIAFGRVKYGRRYKEALSVTGLDYQTLRNYAAVARRFEPSRRRADLSFQHHAELSALPDELQDRWLAAAVAGGWSKAELRRRVREAVAPTARCDAPRTIRLSVPASREQRWRDAAEQTRSDFAAWAAKILDDAAGAVLDESGPGEEPGRVVL